MKFITSHKRGLTGNNLTVEIVAEGDEFIQSVTVTLDGWQIDTMELPPNTSDYKRDFIAAGDAAPGMDHVLIVSARNQHMDFSSSETRWIDV